MRASLLTDNWDQSWSRGVHNDRDHGRQVPLTDASDSLTDRRIELQDSLTDHRIGSKVRLRTKSQQWEEGSRIFVFPEQHYPPRELSQSRPVEQYPNNNPDGIEKHNKFPKYHKQLPPHNIVLPPPKRPSLLKQSSVPPQHTVDLPNHHHSYLSSAPPNRPSDSSSYSQLQSSSYHPDHMSFHPSSPPASTLPMSQHEAPLNTSYPEGSQRPSRPFLSSFQQSSLQSEDDDVFDSNARLPSRYPVPGFPRHSSMKPGQTDGLPNGQPQAPMFNVNDISSVLDPPSELPSQIQVESSQSLSPQAHSFSPSSHPLERDDVSNIPGFYVNNSGTNQPVTMITPAQLKTTRTTSDNESSGSSGRPLGYTREHLHGVVQRLRETPLHFKEPTQLPNQTGFSVPPPVRSANPPSKDLATFSKSHSQLQTKSHPWIKDKEFSDRFDRGKQPFLRDDCQSHVEIPMSRTLSEGSLDYKSNEDLTRGEYPLYRSGYQPKDSSNFINDSHPLLPLPTSRNLPYQTHKQYYYPQPIAYHQSLYPTQSPEKRMRTQTVPFHSFQAYPYEERVPQLPPRGQTFDSQTFLNPRTFESPPQLPLRCPRDSVDQTSGRYVPNQSRYEPVNSLSHSSGIGSSGIGSRNTSQSTGSLPPNRSSGGKGSASFSSMHDADVSSDLSAGPHRKDISVDENYEFDSINCLEKDIMADLRRYSRLSGNSVPPISHSIPMLNQDPSVQSSRYPDSDQRFEKLRQEFKQFRQYHQQPGEIPPPPTASSALPLGTNGEPLYPMDSDML